MMGFSLLLAGLGVIDYTGCLNARELPIPKELASFSIAQLGCTL